MKHICIKEELTNTDSTVKDTDETSKERLVKEIIEEELTNQNTPYRKQDKGSAEEINENIPYPSKDSKLEDTSGYNDTKNRPLLVL